MHSTLLFRRCSALLLGLLWLIECRGAATPPNAAAPSTPPLGATVSTSQPAVHPGVASTLSSSATTTASVSFVFSPSYTFKITDTLFVSVYGEKDLNTTTRVGTDGCINLPLISLVKIVGLTVSEAQHTIEQTYEDQRYLRHPQVSIGLVKVAERNVYIYGEVTSPLNYALGVETDMSVVDLISKAQGFSKYANPTAVTITHFDKEGKPHIQTVNVDEIMKGRDKTHLNDSTLMLQPGDIVYVPGKLI